MSRTALPGIGRRLTLAAVACVTLAVSLEADTLVFRDGRRIQGTVVALREGIVEFDTPRPRGGRERQRIARAEIARIEFDDVDRLGDAFSSNGTDRATAFDEGRPLGMRERDVTVAAEIPWRDTGILLRAGQTIYFRATGRITWGPKRQDGPDGERNSPRNEGRPIPSRPGGALIGRIGEGSEYFFIGSDTGPIRVRTDGRLYLGINDDFLADNAGTFRVTVYY